MSEGVTPKRRRWRRRVVLLGLAVVAVWLFLRDWGPRVPERAFLLIDLRDALVETEADGLEAILEAPHVDLLSLREGLGAAADDPRILAAVVRVGPGALGFAMAEDVAALLDQFRKSGKPVVAYAESPDGPGYAAICGADEILCESGGEISLVGVSIDALLVADALRKLGVEFDLVRVGEFKGVFEQLVSSAPSPEFTSALDDLAHSLQASLIRGIARRRAQTESQVSAAIDEAPLGGPQAIALRLVDAVGYSDELAARVAARVKATAEPITLEDYVSSRRAAVVGERVAVVHIVGIIADRAASPIPGLGEVSGADDVADALRLAREDSGIKGVLLRIDSPGGTVTGSEKIWRAIALTRKVKPVVVSMGSVAASGGYFAACAADRIVAQPSTLTGSIGVVGGKVILEKLLEDRAVHRVEASSGRRAGMFDPFSRFTEDERAAMTRRIEESYRLFLERVTAGRKKTLEEVDRLARGRVWTGAEALDRGLVDALGGVDDALRVLRDLARLGPESRLVLERFPGKRSPLEIITRRRTPSPLASSLDEASALALVGAVSGRPLALDLWCLCVR